MSLFSCCLPFQNYIFLLCFLSINPFLDNIIYFLFLLSLLPFPLLMFPCFFETNFANIPFFKTNLLSCSAVCFFVCCFRFCFPVSCFCIMLCCMLASFWVCLFLLLFCFCFVPWFCFQTMKNIVFPAIWVFSLVSCWLEGSWLFCFMFLFLVFCCVVCFQSKQWSCIALRLCYLLSFFVTRLSGFIVCILCSCFFFCCFVFNCCVFCLFIPVKQGTGHSKNKKQKCRKK